MPCLSSRLLTVAILFVLASGVEAEPPPNGVVATLEDYDGPATLTVRSVGIHKLRLELVPETETETLLIRVELPSTGRQTWPAVDVEVRDAHGEAVVVRRSGLEWHKLRIPVPAVKGTYFVHAVEPPTEQPKRTAEAARRLTDPKTGLRVSVARWFDGRRAALSLRFDDSHPTHLSKAIPLLREYGFRGTFMVNPGADEPGSRRRSQFQAHRVEWEAVARVGDHELANHSAHHRGASGDDEMEAEVGEAARAIRKMAEGRSNLMALNLGGGTQWETSRTLRYYLDKYHLFDASSGSLGMDDVYGNRVAAFRQHIQRHLESRGWCRVHFHSIGDGLSISEANFRAALNSAKEHEDRLWIAGMADIHKYQTERNCSALSVVESDASRLRFRLSCPTEPELYDQLLTIEVAAPPSWPLDRMTVRDSRGEDVAFRKATAGDRNELRFEVAPRTADWTISTGS